jgi:hypothetical protein
VAVVVVLKLISMALVAAALEAMLNLLVSH